MLMQQAQRMQKDRESNIKKAKEEKLKEKFLFEIQNLHLSIHLNHIHQSQNSFCLLKFLLTKKQKPKKLTKITDLLLLLQNPYSLCFGWRFRQITY